MKYLKIIVGITIIAMLVLVWRPWEDIEAVPSAETHAPASPAIIPAAKPIAEPSAPTATEDDHGTATADTDADDASSDDNANEDAEEKLVDAFDELTDRWMDAETEKRDVTMKDIEAFVAQFRQVPKDRQEECLQRALNLIPDEHVMLLAGILMDRSQPKEFAELVFNDILNRDEDVKKPILQQIFRDKTHPCWTDVAWILDVTGEKPDKP